MRDDDPGATPDRTPRVTFNGGSPTPPAAPTSRGSSPRTAAGVDYSKLQVISPEHYIINADIARGGMGRIRLARDRRLGRHVAIKEILIHTGDAVRRFEREVRITARLQHPGIVNVHEAGTWPSGEPFYAMKYVTGKSLHHVIGATSTLAQRLALLPNILAVADAVAYAHSERIVHRDLKPKNVLVGAFGETVVIDWGLAKDLADTTDGDPTSDDGFEIALATDSWKARAEYLLGTPAYMAPEQASGRPADERADVYALGAILDHALSGEEPYLDTSAAEIVAAKRRGPAVALADRHPGIPPDLLAIVDRAMAYNPWARYPTARQLAEDLRRYLTGQLVGAHHYSAGELLRRRLRRHRSAAIVAAIATAVLVAVGGIALQRVIHAQRVAEEERAQAEEERAAAQVSRSAAEDLMSFMLVEMRDKLRPVGRLDLLEPAAKKAVEYYDSRGEALSDAELVKRAIGRENLGDVLLAQGHADGALREYRAALAIAQRLDANSAEVRRLVETLSNKIATCCGVR